MSAAKGFTKTYLTDKLFEDILRRIDKKAMLKTWSSIDENKNIGYITNMVEKDNKDQNFRILGLNPYRLEYTLPNKEEVFQVKIMIKSKCSSHEMYQSVRKLLPESDKSILELFDEHVAVMEFANLEYKELGCVQLDDEIVKSIMPKIYWSRMDPDQEIFVFAMEYLGNESMYLLNTVRDVHLWQEDDVKTTLDDLALFHSRFYEKIADIPNSLRKYVHLSYKCKINDLVPLWKKFLDNNFDQGRYNRKQFELGKIIIRNLPEICDILDKAPHTLLHNDINVMNQCLRKITLPGQQKLCMYDWELCCTGVPQEDIALFFIMVLPEGTIVEKWHAYLRHYHSSLMNHLEMLTIQGNFNNEKANITTPSFFDFEKVFDMSICAKYINRFNWASTILVAHANVDFMPRLMHHLETYLTYVIKKYNFV